MIILNRLLASISKKIKDRIIELLSLLSRASLSRAFALRSLRFNFTLIYKRSVRV